MGRIADNLAANIEECGVRVRRETPQFVGWRLDVGHQWIEIVDGHGEIPFSAGFWPSGNIWWSNGRVKSPDPLALEGLTENTKSLPLQRICDWDCDRVRQCIMDSIARD